MTRLRRVHERTAGYSRRRNGHGFAYLDEQGRPIRGPRLQRLRSLAIPPAWTDVWICPDELGHLQATGTDDAGRTQYLYHPDWREQRDRQKFERIEGFADALPRLRRHVARDLKRPGHPRERVLACAVRLLDRGLFRVGTGKYANHDSYGLATLRRDHVVVGRDRAQFDYVGKGSKRQVREVRDKDVLEILRVLRRRKADPTDRFLAWDGDGKWHDVRAADINAYIKEASGEDFSAKDFRTWYATVLAAVVLAERGPESSARAAKRSIRAAAEAVSEQLGNTPAVARRSYIDPRVFGCYLDGEVIQLTRVPSGDPGPAIEAAVLDLLRSQGSWRAAAEAA